MASSKTIRGLIDDQAVRTPDSVFLSGVERHNPLTFAGLQRQSQNVALLLLEAGLVPGDRVALLMENGPPAAGLLLGAWYGGFVAVPLNPRGGRAHLAHVVEHSEARLVMVSPSCRAELDGIAPPDLPVMEIDPESMHRREDLPRLGKPLREPHPEDDALLIYTSGSTSRPKGVLLSHANLVAAGRNCSGAHGLSPTDRSLCVLPLHHLNAVTVTVLPSLTAGASVVLPPGFNLHHFWDWMITFRCTWSALVPTLISQLLECEDPRTTRGPDALGCIRFLRSSSAALSPSLHQTFEARFALPLIEAMGSTEAGGAIFSNPLPPGKRKTGSPGLAYGFETRIVDPEGRDVSPGECGELQLRGPSVMQRYHRNPQETARAFTGDGWLRTGDLARMDSDGYLFLVGRARELIIKGGINIAPREIDEALESHADVLEAAVVGIPDHHWGENVLAFVKLRSGVRGDAQKLLDHCERTVGHLKTPVRIHFVDDFPRGPSGKIQRMTLAGQYPDLLGDEAGAVREQPTAMEVSERPNLRTEDQIARVWAKILGTEQVNRTDNFFALGGHSLPAMRVLARLGRELGVEVSLTEFLRHPTVESQARIVSARLRQMQPRARPVPTEGPISIPSPLSAAQLGIWCQLQMNTESSAYHECEAIRLEGSLNQDALREALNVVISRHGSLRTVFPLQDTGPVQVVLKSWRMDLPIEDLAGLPTDDRHLAVQRHLKAEPQQPFDLATVPGIRVRLLRLGPKDHILILILHHLICDRTSIGILSRELGDAYHDAVDGHDIALPPPLFQQVNVTAEPSNGATEDRAAAIQYWKLNLAGVHPSLDLPTLGSRPKVFTPEGRQLTHRIGGPVYDRVRDLSRRERVSPFTVLLSAYSVLIHSLTHRLDFLIGVPVAKRDRPELESVFGLLVDLLPLRVDLSREPSFAEILHRIHDRTLEGMAHRSVPLSEIVQCVNPPRDPSRSPLLQVTINWKDRSSLLQSVDFEGLQVSPVTIHSQASKFDLTLALIDWGNDLDLEVEFCTRLFSEEMIQSWLKEYRRLLNAALRDPQQGLRSLLELGRDGRQSQSPGLN